MFSLRVLCVLVVLSVVVVDCYKILLLTVPVSKGSKSQLDLMVHLGETLSRRGHNVTIIMQVGMLGQKQSCTPTDPTFLRPTQNVL